MVLGGFLPLRDFIRIYVYYCITPPATAWERFECSYMHSAHVKSKLEPHLPGALPTDFAYLYIIYIHSIQGVHNWILGRYIIWLHLKKYEKIVRLIIVFINCILYSYNYGFILNISTCLSFI